MADYRNSGYTVTGRGPEGQMVDGDTCSKSETAAVIALRLRAEGLMVSVKPALPKRVAVALVAEMKATIGDTELELEV